MSPFRGHTVQSVFAAAVTSLTTEDIPANSSGNPSVLLILGEDDDLIPYEGGEGVAGYVFLSGDESVRTVYTGCIDADEVVNYKVANAGHDLSSEFEGGHAALM